LLGGDRGETESFEKEIVLPFINANGKEATPITRKTLQLEMRGLSTFNVNPAYDIPKKPDRVIKISLLETEMKKKF